MKTEQQLDREERKKFKQTENLINAVKGLEQRLVDQKKIEAKGGFSSFALGRIGGSLQEKFSAKNLASKIGMGSGTLVGDFLNARELHKQEETDRSETEAKEAHKFAKAYLTHTEEGRAARLQDENKAMERAIELYEERKKLEHDIDEIEARIKLKKEVGAKVTKDELKDLTAKRNLYETFLHPKEQGATPVEEPGYAKVVPEKFNKKVESRSLAEQIAGSPGFVNDSISGYEKHTKTKLSESERGEFKDNLITGIYEELVSLSEKQLKELIEIRKGTIQSEEDKYEAQKKAANPLNEIKAVKTEEKSSSFLDTALGLLKNFPVGKIASIAAPVISAASGLLGGAASGVSTMAANPLTSLVGGGIAATGAATSIMASEAGKPLREAVTGNTMLGAMGGDNSVAAGILSEAEGKTKKQIAAEDAKLEADREALKDAPWYTRLYGIGKESYLEGRKKFATLSKQESPSRELQSLDLNKAEKQSEVIQREKEMARETKAAPASVNTSVVTNNTTKSINVSPPVRNFDPTFNDRLSASLRH